MNTHQHFRRSALALALAAVFPIASALADEEVAELISPNVTEASLNLPFYTKVNPLYRQYDGVNSDGFNGNVDLNVVRRNQDAEWFKLNARNLGLRTQEMGVSYEKQGDWSVSLDYNQIPRYSPYAVTTAVSGVGSSTITQPSTMNTATAANNPAASDVTLMTQRDITTLAASKFLARDLKLSFSFRNEDKTGTRMSGVRGQAGNGTVNLYSGFLFAPERIDQSHKQLEATLDYTSASYQLSGGYYGSYLSTMNNSLTIVPGVTGGGTALVSPTLSPIAQAPDNSFQQLWASGAYNLSKDTRANLKVSYSEGRQQDAFFAATQTPPLIPGIGDNLGARVTTSEVFSSLTSRLTRDLKMLASWRYEDKQDKTPVRLFASSTTAGVTTNYFNNPESHVANWGKLEATYRLMAGFNLTGGVDYTDKSSREWARHDVNELTTRLALSKTMGETLNGTVSVAHSERKGAEWNNGTAPPVYPVYLADRKRDKLRGMLDWSASERLNLQFGYEAYFDDYNKSLYGLDSGQGQMFSVDGSYAFNDVWKLNAWYAKQIGESKQNSLGAACSSGSSVPGGSNDCTLNTYTNRGTPPDFTQWFDWSARIRSNSDQVGFGLTGRIRMVDVGINYLFMQDRNEQKANLPAQTATGNVGGIGGTYTFTPLATGMGVLPDTKYTQNTLRLNGVYPLSKATKVRLDYIFDLRKMDDYTWAQWVYADGTKVYVKPEQTTQVIGLSLLHAF